MGRFVVMVLVLMSAGVAGAYDLGNGVPVKPPASSFDAPPEPTRQGGDFFDDAFVIPSVPFHDTGTTTGYADDVDEFCPYTGMAPDVFYVYTATADAPMIDVDLCYSSYDTKVFIYTSDHQLVACNDDFYFDPPCYAYSSRLENVQLTAGETYYIVVDGFWNANGDYDLVITPHEPCAFICPTPSTPEGEPDLYDGYVDDFDRGCGSPNLAFRDLTYAFDVSNPDGPDPYGQLTLCGGSGWYYGPSGSNYRDTDWYYLQMGDGGAIDVTVDAGEPTYIFELGPQDCASVAVVQAQTGGACQEAEMTITGYDAGGLVWFWVGPTTFSAPDGSHPFNYDYACWFTGLFPRPVATTPASWSTLKAIFE